MKKLKKNMKKLKKNRNYPKKSIPAFFIFKKKEKKV